MAVHHTGFIVAETGQIYRGYTNSDYGIDGEVGQIRSSKIEIRKKSEVRTPRSSRVCEPFGIRYSGFLRVSRFGFRTSASGCCWSSARQMTKSAGWT